MASQCVELVFAEDISPKKTITNKTESLLTRETVAIQELAAISTSSDQLTGAQVIFDVGPTVNSLLSDNSPMEYDTNRSCYKPNLSNGVLTILSKRGKLPNVHTIRKELQYITGGGGAN